MKRFFTIFISMLILGSSSVFAQDSKKAMGIQALELTAKDIYLGDTIKVTLSVRNYKIDAIYDPAEQPYFVSVGLPAGSRVVTIKAGHYLYNTGAYKFSPITVHDSFNFTFNAIDTVNSTLSGDNVVDVSWTLIGANVNPPGATPIFGVQLQYPFGDPLGNPPNTLEAISPVLTVSEPLSVGLGMFTAIKTDNNTVDLDWTTMTEQNSKGFEIERSVDGRNWSSIGFVSSQADNGNSRTSLKYAYEDLQPNTGYNYYRLKQLEVNGNFEYSDVRKVFFDDQTQNTITIYPNPAVQSMNVQGLESGDVIYVFDVSGKTVKVVYTFDSTVKFNVSDLAAGTYFLKVNEDKFQAKFIKE